MESNEVQRQTSMASCESCVVLVSGTSCTRPVMSSAVLLCMSAVCFTGFCNKTHPVVSAGTCSGAGGGLVNVVDSRAT